MKGNMKHADDLNQVTPAAPQGRSVECFRSDVEGKSGFLFTVSYMDGPIGTLQSFKVTEEEMVGFGFKLPESRTL